MHRDKPIKVLIIGFGPLGLRLAQNLIDDSRFDLKAIVDNDSKKLGQNFENIEIKQDLIEVIKSDSFDLAFVTTSSQIEKIKETIFQLTKNKVNVISSCEELIFPLDSHPELSREIDELAKANDIRVLGTGINPGFLMDYFVSTLAKPFLKLKKVFYQRNINTNFRRSSFKNKVGVGMTLEEFETKKQAGHIGHVGFKQSVDMLAHHFSWKLKNYSEHLEPVMKESLVKGIDQKAISKYEEGNSIELCFMAVEDLQDSDRIVLDFEDLDVPMLVRIPSGINGETGTVSMLMNSAQKLLTLNPGLKTMLDL
jgi:2,4-diaminopentanoate dehydrogenase